MTPTDSYTMEFRNSDRDEMIYSMTKAVQSPLDMDIIRWKMGLISFEKVAAIHGLSRATLNRRLSDYKARAEASLLEYRLNTPKDSTEFAARVEAANEWLTTLEPDYKS